VGAVAGGDGVKIDLHLHTAPRSPCSVMEPLEAVQAAARLGLDAVCFTEHHRIWPRDELDALEDAAGIKVFGGTEITTDQGDILVYGLPRVVADVVPIAELRPMVAGDGGYMVAAHPFRGFRLFGLGQLGMDTASAAEREVFAWVDAIEVCNGRLTDAENETALEVAEVLGLPGMAGSDAHRLDEIGHCLTIIDGEPQDELELVEALRSGAFRLDGASSS
jgi:predicted metal-dependent phosphoesterase TrpH